jgi:hypothetical protein
MLFFQKKNFFINLDWCIFEDETTGDPVMEDKIYWIAIDFLFKINRL